MTQTDSPSETFASFKDSFSYGSRSDMNFKFFKQLPEDKAAAFLQRLLGAISVACDRGDIQGVDAIVRQGQAEAYAVQRGYDYDEGPFHVLQKPVARSKLALLTSSGHYVEGCDPRPLGVADMTQQEAERRVFEFLKAEPQLSEIPLNVSMERLRVRHGGYDIRGAQADPNVNFPLQRLQELRQEGHIGDLLPTAYSFVGACSQTKLLKNDGPRWAVKLKDQGVEAVLLVPV